MENLNDIKNLISEAKNICVIPPQSNEPESLTAALALFYTLKELGPDGKAIADPRQSRDKNVNLIIQQLPETLQFLTPSIDYISQPKNFVISIPKNVAEISQVYYEKNEENLKIHLTIDKGSIKKDNLSFYFTDAKPDLTITLGIQNFQKELEGKLDSFGFLLDSPILNLDNNPNNMKFGKINTVTETSLSEIVLEIKNSFDANPVSKHAAQCLLTGLTLYYQNFQSPNVSSHVFELCAQLMKQGANRQEIIENVYRPKDHKLSFRKEEIVPSL